MSIRTSIAALIRTMANNRTPALPVDDDPNVGFEPPADAAWLKVRFVDGAETQRAIGGATSPVAQPVLVYVDAMTPLADGDGLSVELADAVMGALRRAVVPEGRWKRFEAGAEGPEDGRYRKQVVALFWRTRRV